MLLMSMRKVTCEFIFHFQPHRGLSNSRSGVSSAQIGIRIVFSGRAYSVDASAVISR